METGNGIDLVSLRDATSDDVAFLREVYASTREEELSVTGWPAEQKAEFCRMQFEAQDAHYRTYYPEARYSLIERAGEKVGRLSVERSTRGICIMDIALLAAHRGQGIGSVLLLQLQEEARVAGKILTIHVEKFNPALRLYERLGFRAVEDKGIYLLLNWQAS